MKSVAIFNRVGPDNIGLENFLAQERDGEARILVIGQTVESAREFLSTSYPASEVGVASVRDWPGGWLLAGIRAIRDLGGDIVHVHHTAGAVIAAVGRLGGGYRLVATAHNNFSRYRWYQKVGFLFAFLVSDRVICNSEGTKKSLPRLVRRGKTGVIHNGVDFDRLDRACEGCGLASGAFPRAFTVGTVCRIVQQKDLPTLIEGFAAARERTDVPLLLRIVGDGPERQDLMERVRVLGIESVVEFTGAVPRDQAYRYLAGMDAFVISSRWEGFCNAMVEAAAAGKPVIATNITPLPEVIGDECALFFEVGDSRGLADRIGELVTSTERRKTLGERGRVFVRRHYSLERSAERYRLVYEELAQIPRPRFRRSDRN